MSLEQWAAIAQIFSALATVILAIAVFYQIRAAREQTAATRETVAEMERSRLEQERPQVIVDADYRYAPKIYIVVRNIGKGAAKDITFEFSASMESSSPEMDDAVEPLDKQPLFEHGLDFLAPGAEVSFYWDEYLPLKRLLEERGLTEGIRVTSKYKALTAKPDATEPYSTEWTINPLSTGGRLQQQYGTLDIVKAIKGIRQELKKWRET